MTKLSKLRLEDLNVFEPLTQRQGDATQAWDSDENLVLNGSAGTGKTYLGCALGMRCVLSNDFPEIKKLVVIRSVVPTRDIGFLPGTEEEKTEVYKAPYIQIFDNVFKGANAYKRAESSGQVEFETTSFLRGKTISNAVILIDEMQNCNGRELNTIMTRVGQDCRVIFAGDYYQSDFFKGNEKGGILSFLRILQEMTNFTEVEFTWSDIVRSNLVRDFIMTKERLQKDEIIRTDW
jgi:phosphate starvation-inducible PhoH-like protein